MPAVRRISARSPPGRALRGCSVVVPQWNGVSDRMRAAFAPLSYGGKRGRQFVGKGAPVGYPDDPRWRFMKMQSVAVTGQLLVMIDWQCPVHQNITAVSAGSYALYALYRRVETNCKRNNRSHTL